MDITFETKRLSLQVLPPSYAANVLAFYESNRNYFDIWEPARPNTFYTEQYQSANLSFEFNHIVDSSFLRYWIFLKENPSEIIGTICFHNILKGALQSCMIGYKIDRNHCRKGYGTEACLAAIDVIFDSYHLHRLEAFVHPDNHPSIRLIEKLNFIREGLAHSCAQVNGQWEDHYQYALINPSHH